jgi:mono/diheme cytochrome c family protein
MLNLFWLSLSLKSSEMKSAYTLPVIFLIFCAFAFLSGKQDSASVSGSVTASDSSAIPPAVYQILASSCLDCHGEGGKTLALAKVKMGEWGSYSPEKQASKADDMCKMVTKGKMPPKGYLKDHPEKALTPEQIQVICDWSSGLNSEK